MTSPIDVIDADRVIPVEEQRSTLVTLVAAVLLAAVAMGAPILVARSHPGDDDVARETAKKPVSLAGITVPGRDGGDLVCRSRTSYNDSVQRWTCGETVVTAKSGGTTDDPDLALARYVRMQLLDREPDTSDVEDLGGDARLKRADRPKGRLVAVSVPQEESSSVYFTFAGGDPDALAQPLIDDIRSQEDANVR
ncbi:hypothetical protein GCM10009631_12630 [Corynebacterium glaucum]|uniref:hypothetical protein n=1 Tax=Corynebacterium glaucum TaxID=187491 RepID=UPI0012FD94AD|nr:hypothetical protein [Corynebacterium glaucum]